MRAVMVGGPLHGQVHTFADDQLSREIRVARPASWVSEFGLFELSDQQPYRYELGWYQGHEVWPPCGPASRQPAYLCREEPIREHAAAAGMREQDRYFAEVADMLWHGIAEAALPVCVVPGCEEKGRMTFTAAERGRLAAREWQRGDEIRLCPRHGHDVYRAQGARGMDQLAEWLRPDAMWDRLDAYDSEDPLYGAEILKRTARMLRLAVPSR